MADEPVPMRVSHDDRERALARLQDAMTQGMLDATEFSERSGLVVVARTTTELAAVTADLPAAVVDENSVVELRAASSSLKRDGDWIVPRTLVITLSNTSARLDLTRARIAHPVVDVDLDVRHSSVQMWLPAGASAVIDEVEANHSRVRDRRRAALHSGTPRFVFTGELHHSSLRIR